jgi:hypothetical protein
MDADAEYVAHPGAEGAVLAEIAARRPDLQAAIARHPHAYDGLLDWIAAYGGADAQAAVAARRAPAAVPSGPDTAAEPTAAPSAGRPARSGVSRRGILIAAGSVVAAVVLLGGGLWIATLVNSAVVQTAAAEEPSAPEVPNDCDAYLALSPEQREAAFAGKTNDVFDSTGYAQVPVITTYDAECPAHAGETYTLFDIDLELGHPDCGAFLALTEEQRASWLPGLIASDWPLSAEESTVSSLTQACTDLALPADRLRRVADYLASLGHHMTWTTETKLGYSWHTTLGVGAPVLSAPAEGGVLRDDGTRSREFTPGAACGFDPDTDALIPLSLLMTSTTGNAQKIVMSSRWSLTVAPGTSPVTRAYLEGDYDDQSTCSDAATTSVTEAMGVQFQADDEVWSEGHFWIVLKNWRSPRYPAGATPDLADYVLSSVRTANSDEDPLVNMTTASMKLDGARG